MAGEMSKRAATEDIEMQMTPMIDVTFLLLIFFLCSIKFKLLDGKMQTYLPKDVGVNTTPIDIEMEKIEVDMKYSRKAPMGFNLFINREQMPDLNTFYQKIRAYHQRAPELKCTIYPGDKIEYGMVVKVVNECLRARLSQISFGGAPPE